VYANRRRIGGSRGRRLARQRGERIDRSFAHRYDTSGMRRTHLRGHTNILQRLLIHAGGFNLGLVMRHLIGSAAARRADCRIARRPSSPGFWRSRAIPDAGWSRVSHRTYSSRPRADPVPDHYYRLILNGDHLHHGLLGVKAGRKRR
jgi:hypothetical protein